MFVVLTTIPIDPDCREEVLKYVTDLSNHSENEEGTVRYHAVEDITESNVIRFFEQYEDAAAVEAHTESEPYRRFMKALPEFVDGTMESVQFEADDVSITEFTAMDAVEAID